MLQDFRYGLRVLAAKPGFTLAAALSLALGIGANSAIFSLVDGLWLRPMAVSRPGEIVRIFSTTDQDREATLSYPEYLDIQKQVPALRDVVAIGGRGAMLVEGNTRQLVTLNLVSSNFFTALGVQPERGRLFTAEDEASDPGALLVVLGNSFWQRQYGGDPSIVGKQIRLQRGSEVPATVIGVLPASFRSIQRGGDRDLWFPRQSWGRLGDIRELEQRDNRWFHAVGRLAPGSTVKAANAQANTLARRMETDWPETNRGRRANVVPDFRYRMQQAGDTGAALLAIVLLVVLLSSVNVAHLLLSRSGARAKEMAMRAALGASRQRLVRQLMAENTLLGLAGLILGLGAGMLLIAVLPSLLVQPPGLHATLDFLFDSRVFVFSLGVSLLTIVLFGLAPAWKAARPTLIPALKGESAAATGGRGWFVRHPLVVVQIAVSLTVLACAGVLARSFANTRLADLGFSRKPLLNVWLSASGAKPSLYREVASRLAALPGVRSVALAVRAPLSLSGNGMFQQVTFPGRPEFANTPPVEIKYNAISPNFLRTMGTPVVRGRDFESREETGTSDSVLINETMAQRFWPNAEPIGDTLRIGSAPGKLVTVAGVVRNTPINAVGEPPEPYLYLPYWANFDTEVTFLMETSGSAASLAQPVRRALKEVDASIDPLGITTEEELIRYSAETYQVTAELAGALGVLGLILTAVGLYGVVSYSVNQRTREFGIRMALGADRADTLRLVLREVMALGTAGVVVGLPMALAATRLLTSLLFGVRPWDAPVFTAAATLLLGVLLGAGFLPARRATNIEPAAAIRTV